MERMYQEFKERVAKLETEVIEWVINYIVEEGHTLPRQDTIPQALEILREELNKREDRA